MSRFSRRFTYQGKLPEKAPEQEHPDMTVAFVGNPNCGKTTLFNALTGSTLKTANWPGVTVEGKEGSYVFEGNRIALIDLPGAYSLTSYTMEEEVTSSLVYSDTADVIVDVVDASCLERSLYLTLELLALKKPVVVALNMMDVVEKRGLEIDIHRLAETLGAPVIPISARKRQGLQSLVHAAYHHKESGLDPILHEHDIDDGMAQKHAENVVVYTKELEEKIDAVQGALENDYPDAPNPRWVAIKLLEGDRALWKKYPLNEALLKGDVKKDGTDKKSRNDIAQREQKEAEGKQSKTAERNRRKRKEKFQGEKEADRKSQRPLEQQFIRERYDFIQDIIHECVFNNHAVALRSDKADRILTNKYLAIPIFLLVMGFVFFLTFFIGDAIKGVFEQGLDVFNSRLETTLLGLGASEWLVSLLCDGVISGVGTVLTFLPNIFILFLALAFLEDSGYMSRVAYIMDSVMSYLGLSGRAFIPMILGFGCTVPAVLSTRTLESKRDKRRVMVVSSFMSCSARLPIYILLAGLFFAHFAALVAFSMYFLGIVVALLTLALLHAKDKRAQEEGEEKGEDEGRLLIELPDYKMPDAHSIWVYVWDKIKDYIFRAGTVIFIASIVIWLLLNFGFSGYLKENYVASFAGYLGHLFVPVLAPFGCGDWRLAVALIAGISAKEVVVSSLSVLFGVSGAAVGAGALSAGFAAIGFGPANALGFMIFVLLYVPCIAAIATIRSESKSAKFTVLTMVYQIAIAWTLAVIVFNLARLLGL